MELAFLKSQLDCQGNHITKGCRMEGYRHLLKSSMGMTKLNETGCPRKQFSHSSCLLAGFHSIAETFLQELINFHILGPGELPMLLRIGRFFLSTGLEVRSKPAGQGQHPSVTHYHAYDRILHQQAERKESKKTILLILSTFSSRICI